MDVIHIGSALPCVSQGEIKAQVMQNDEIRTHFYSEDTVKILTTLLVSTSTCASVIHYGIEEKTLYIFVVLID
jgi:hypothetical protein